MPKPVYFPEMAAHKGKMIGMFRLPENKISAGFVNAFESCPTMQHEHGPSCNPRESYAIGSCARRDEPGLADGGEVLQLRQGVPGEHAEQQVLRRRRPEVPRRRARGHPRHLQRVRGEYVPNEAEIKTPSPRSTAGTLPSSASRRYADSVRKLRAYLTGQGATAMMGKNRKVARMGELEDLEPLVPYGDGPDVVKNAEARVAGS